jgi:ABC-type proline/glycine betaine transport system substrate-binding protein
MTTLIITAVKNCKIIIVQLYRIDPHSNCTIPHQSNIKAMNLTLTMHSKAKYSRELLTVTKAISRQQSVIFNYWYKLLSALYNHVALTKC